jgi:hypothetical protein
MATGNRFNAWVEAVQEGNADWTDSFALALTNTAPTSADSLLADISQISYANLSSRGLTITASGQTAGTFTATCARLVLTASGAVAPFRYVVMYDDTATGDPLVQWWDNGVATTMQAGDTFTFGGAPTFTIWTDAPA